jgi:hypothetical protein
MTRFPVTGRSILVFAIPLALLILASGLVGLLCDSTYAKETQSWTTQGIAQDIFDVVILAPVILLAAIFARKRSRPALFILLGSLIYACYTFAIYCFALHFNPLFLVYCGVLGLSFYAGACMLSLLNLEELKGWFDPGKSVAIPSAFLIVVAVAFCFLWLSEDIPAIIHNRVPETIVEAGLMTNPVHVLDLAFLLPGSLVCGLLLRKKHPLGYLFAPSLLAFLAMMSLSIGGIAVYSNSRGMSSGVVLPSVFALLAGVNGVLFATIVRKTRKEVA